MDFSDIHFHDSTIIRVIELAGTNDLHFEVLYPLDWENNVFEPRTIAFSDVTMYRIDEGPFAGAPTMLDVYDLGMHEQRRRIEIQTNAGTRTVEFGRVALLQGVEKR